MCSSIRQRSPRARHRLAFRFPRTVTMAGPTTRTGRLGGLFHPAEHLLPSILDALFYAHDLAYQNSSNPTIRAAADVTLIHGIEALTEKHQLDAEASFYGGAAILGVAASMALNGHPLSLGQLILADVTALYDIQYGFSHFNSSERTLAQTALQNIIFAFTHEVQVASTPHAAFTGSMSRLVQAIGGFAAGTGSISSPIGLHANDFANPVLTTNFQHHHG
jgi:hypothetical protein